MADSSPSLSEQAAIVWFRDDLRIDANPALREAIERGADILALYIFDEKHHRPLGGASRWWLHHSLEALKADLNVHNVTLCIRSGDAGEVLRKVVKDVGAKAVFWNRRYTASGIKQDSDLKSGLKEKEIEVKSFNANLLHEPWTIETNSGGPYRVFTPFSRAAREKGEPDSPRSAPKSWKVWTGEVDSLEIEDLGLLPTEPDWAQGLRDTWQPGTKGARALLKSFVEEKLSDYRDGRDSPALDVTSRLSPHLRFGEISPQEVWHAAEVAGVSREAVFKFQQELLWREFSHHLLYHYPDLASVNYQSKFDAFPWRDHESGKAAEQLRAWQKGQTGYPIVDAGMRQLWHTGWMHNRLRMIVASFLIKHLMIDWRVGEAWFWDTLVDADPANNSAGWQWVAGSGADAAPYFRIFNPITQGEKFDGAGDYTRHWVPELAKLPDKHLYEPWSAPKSILKDAGVELGKDYPKPLVDHKQARERALEAFKSIGDSASDD